MTMPSPNANSFDYCCYCVSVGCCSCSGSKNNTTLGSKRKRNVDDVVLSGCCNQQHQQQEPLSAIPKIMKPMDRRLRFGVLSFQKTSNRNNNWMSLLLSSSLFLLIVIGTTRLEFIDSFSIKTSRLLSSRSTITSITSPKCRIKQQICMILNALMVSTPSIRQQLKRGSNHKIQVLSELRMTDVSGSSHNDNNNSDGSVSLGDCNYDTRFLLQQEQRILVPRDDDVINNTNNDSGNPVVTKTNERCQPRLSTIIVDHNIVQTTINQHADNTAPYSNIVEDQRNTSNNVIDPKLLPRHVAIVMDGNSRWATRRNLPKYTGHAFGADQLLKYVLPALQNNYNNSIQYCTVYAFSTENWRRPTNEIQELMFLMEMTAQQYYNQIVNDETKYKDIRIRIVGNIYDTRIPIGLRHILLKIQAVTHERTSHLLNDPNNAVFTLSLAINYGGRQDIVDATKHIVKQMVTMMQENNNSNTNMTTIIDDTITEDYFQSYLSTNGIPDPDLIIRSSGEYRLSNFLLWNSAYSELYITDTLWPDFNASSLHDSILWYARRQRRFGGVQ